MHCKNSFPFLKEVTTSFLYWDFNEFIESGLVDIFVIASKIENVPENASCAKMVLKSQNFKMYPQGLRNL